MERIDLKHLANVVGLYYPWIIESVDIDDAKRTLTINATSSETKQKRFSLLSGRSSSSQKKSSSTNEQSSNHSWQTVNFGQYRTIICIADEGILNGIKSELDKKVIDLPHFMGSPVRPYSNLLRQKVAVARFKGVPNEVISQCLSVTPKLIDAITQDIAQLPEEKKELILLPTELDPVWSDLLHDKLHIKTALLPFKFLQSKLKLSVSKNDNENNVRASCIELRRFFLNNIHQLKKELGQLCGLHSGSKSQEKSKIQKPGQRLVLPATNSGVWIDLLTGKLNLNSQSVPLRLLISRQCNVFVNSETNDEKIQTIETLRSYFRKHCRQLKAELILINRALAIRSKQRFSLPDPSHSVWQKILNDDHFLPSDHMAYRLLLSKLRGQLERTNDPVYSIEAAKNIRKFIAHNQKNMRNELAVLFKQVKAM